VNILRKLVYSLTFLFHIYFCSVYVLPLGGQNAEIVINALNKNKYEIRRSVNKLVSLKYSPDLKFVLDRTFDQLDETRRLLEQDVVKRDVASDNDL
jgi:ribosome-binding factor A